jgi:hypothetical protein
VEELDRNFRRDFIERFLNFVGGFCQSVGIDIDSDAAIRTGHVLVRLEPADGLYEVLPATRTLKSDFMGARFNHQRPPFSFPNA